MVISGAKLRKKNVLCVCVLFDETEMSDYILDPWESLSLGDSPGSVAPAGIRWRGVPGDDKGISWHSSSDCLHTTADAGVNAAVTTHPEHMSHRMHVCMRGLNVDRG